MKAKKPKTSSAERMRKLRADNKSKGLEEVRGLYMPPEFHNQVKAYARSMLKLKQAANKKRPADPLLD